MSLTSFIQEKEVREKFLQTFSTTIIEANKRKPSAGRFDILFDTCRVRRRHCCHILTRHFYHKPVKTSVFLREPGLT
jgi:hypothetical protein